MFKKGVKIHTDIVESLGQWDRPKLWGGVFIGREGFGYSNRVFSENNRTSKILGHNGHWYTLLLKISTNMSIVDQIYVLL